MFAVYKFLKEGIHISRFTERKQSAPLQIGADRRKNLHCNLEALCEHLYVLCMVYIFSRSAPIANALCAPTV
jgi:hypothetical protein